MEEEDNSDDKKIAENSDYLEALNSYYKLKFNYENEFNKDKNKIINNETLSWKEKRREFNALKKKCVNCKRPIGTVFSNTYDNKIFTRVLKAMCGDLQNPCPLNITIHTGYFDLLPKTILSDEKDIEMTKVSIIKDKNNLLFNYITTEEALANFEHFKTEIKDITSSLEISNELFINITDNPKKIEIFKKLQLDIYSLINEIKVIIDEFSKTNNTLLIQDAVNIYVNRLTIKLKQLVSMKYTTNRVDFEEHDATYHLIQEKYNIQLFEYNYGKNEVVKYNIGLGTVSKNNENVININTINVNTSNINATNINTNKQLKTDNDSDNDFFNQNVINNNSNSGELFSSLE